MVARSYIRSNLEFCARKYAKARGKREAIFHAKMAVLDLCGWIELSFDEIVLACAKRNLSKQAHVKLAEREIVGKTNGFDYDKHFSNMLIRLIGLIEFEKLENKIDQSKLAKFKAALSTLKSERDREAHTYVKGVTKTISAPSVIQSLFQDVDTGLSEFEARMKSIKP